MKEAFEPRVRRLWGDEVEDRFSWLEDPERGEVISFLKHENDRVDAELAPLANLKQQIFDEIKERVQETDLSVPIRKDQWEYYGRTEEGQQYGRHCRRLAAIDAGEPGPEVVILDENVLAGDSDYFDMGVFDISDDHQLCLYGIDVDGDEKYSLYLLDIEAGTTKTLPLTGVSSGSAWDNAGTSFLYLRPDETNRPAEVWHHVVGTNAADDSCVYVEPDPQFFVGLAKDRDDSFVHISIGSAVTDETRLIPANDLRTDPVVVRPRQFGIEYGIAHQTDSGGQSVFYLHTNLDAKNFRLLTAPEDAVLTGEFDIGEWTEVVPNRDDVTLGGLDVFAGHLVLVERSNGLLQLRVKRFSDGQEHLIEQAEEVSTVYPGANPDANTTSFRYVYASMVTPTQVCSYDLNTRVRTVLKQTPVLGGFDSATYATERVWATASDGTKIPIIMTWRRDRGEGPHPMVLYGYGSYEATMDPSFSVSRLSLLDRSFTFAVAQVRGGGELGRSWYEAAKFEHKERSFTDFVTCAQEMINRGLTTPAQLGIRGGSAGGLLVGAAVNMAPELFGAVVAEVPFVDVVNTMIDTSQQLTQIEWDEWGNPLESEQIYRAMMAYSPYENVREVPYPPMFVTTGINDPRVRFWEPAKWILQLRERTTSAASILLKTEMGAGHFGSTGRYDAWRDEAEVLAFLIDRLTTTRFS